MTRSELQAEIDRLKSSSRPILCGPWLGEVGFELLYWVPFLRWVIQSAKISPDRVWILSRGGPRSWYGDFSAHYLEAYEALSVDALRDLNIRRVAEQAVRGREFGLRRRQVTAKQFGRTEAEAPLLAYATQRMGHPDPLVLHPSVLYRVFRPFWRPPKGNRLFEAWTQMTRLQRITPDLGAISNRLPERYIAVKAYTSEACRLVGPNADAMRGLIRSLQRTLPVVLLHTGHSYDEHGELELQAQGLTPSFDVRSNLEQQTAIVAGAQEFVSTYGGFAYLGPLVGTPTRAVFTHANFRRDHRDLMKRVAKELLRVTFSVTSLTAYADGRRAA